MNRLTLEFNSVFADLPISPTAHENCINYCNYGWVKKKKNYPKQDCSILFPTFLILFHISLESCFPIMNKYKHYWAN